MGRSRRGGGGEEGERVDREEGGEIGGEGGTWGGHLGFLKTPFDLERKHSPREFGKGEGEGGQYKMRRNRINFKSKKERRKGLYVG